MSQTTLDDTPDRARDHDRGRQLALVCVWAAEPERVGEVLGPLAPGRPFVFGRGDERDVGGETRVFFVRQRPGLNETTAPVTNPYLSRAQIRVRNDGETLLVERLGKRALVGPSGKEVDRATVHPGDLVEIRRQMIFLCAPRAQSLEPLRALRGKPHVFGSPDAHGLVGESPAAWVMREEAAFAGQRDVHVLLLGESGTGKEVIASAIHAHGPRAQKKIVSRNAATLPSGIIDAELFGNVANYPNAGMPERAGLIGEADGSTLFLDEIGELPEELQTRLLRVLDERGEYQRLGDARRRTSDFRFIGATNRPLDSLKHDVAARLRLRVHLPGLETRKEDVILIARHLLRRVAARDSDVGARFFEGDPKTGQPRIAPELARALVSHRYTTHVRELDALLWRSLQSSKGDTLELTEKVEEELAAEKGGSHTDPSTLTADDVRAALKKSGGSRDRAFRELGLANRHVLKRLIKKLGIADDES